LTVVRETSAVIGPLVQPGHAPCLRCVELARADRDPAWPVLSAQLVGDPVEDSPDVVLATIAAAIAAAQVLAYVERLDGERPPPVVGAMLVLDLVGLRLRRRVVPAQPACGCGGEAREGTMAG
jgi:bacteriocin biosynthesis cyclodehydratase domain-containing protein